MIVCPNCQQNEYPGALFCSKCGAQLVQNKRAGSTTTIYTSIPDASSPTQTPSFPTPPEECKDALVALIVLDTSEAIFLHSREDFSLGRATPGQPIVPDIDLTPHNAYETGVSRLHASLNISNRPVSVQDLGSVNGTRVNGKKLPPHSATSLTNGDILTLGKLKVQILIKDA
jgi:pSer/pThr/pTyr-binding forkhead associated (FHA) protein